MILLDRINKLREQVDVGPFMKVALIDDAQFTNADVETSCYVTSTQLHNWVSRDWIRLTGANPGKGRRRLYSGGDAISVAIAAALRPFAMMQVAEQLVRIRQVTARAHRLLTDPTFVPGYALAIVPEPNGEDWLYVPLFDGGAEPEIPMPSCVVLDVDRLIVETLENLLLVMNGQPVAARNFPAKPDATTAEDEYLAFTGGAYRDEEGRRIYRGLSAEESAEWDGLLKRDRSMPEEVSRSSAFFRRNEAARLAYLSETFEQRAKEAGIE